MTRRRAVALALGLVAVVLVAAVAVAALRRPASETAMLSGRPVAVTVAVTPVEPQFGDWVVTTVEVVVDPRRVDPGSVRVDGRFAPFAVASSTSSRRTEGGLAVLRVVERLDCLTSACLPAGETKTVRFPALRVAYAGGAVAASWPAVRIHARVQAADLARPMLRVSPPVASTSYRLPPGATGWTLLALALAAALGGLALLARVVAPLLRPGRREAPLELLLAELGTANGDGVRRRAALERLARELEPLDEPLSFESRVLAWAPQDPPEDVVSDLARRVREAIRA